MTSKLKMPIGLDAALPLTEDPTDLFYKLNKTIKSSTRQNLKMLLLTSPGERIMLPQYGVGLKRYLFEQAPDFEIDEKIREQISIYAPQVIVISLNISRDNPRVIAKSGNSNTLAVELIYEISGYNLRDSLILVDTLTSN